MTALAVTNLGVERARRVRTRWKARSAGVQSIMAATEKRQLTEFSAILVLIQSLKSLARLSILGSFSLICTDFRTRLQLKS